MCVLKKYPHKLGSLVHWTFDGDVAIEPDQFLGIILKIRDDHAQVWWILTDHTNEMLLEDLKLVEIPVQN